MDQNSAQQNKQYPQQGHNTFYQQAEYVIILLALRQQLDPHLQQDLQRK